MCDAILPLARAYQELTGTYRHLKNVKTFPQFAFIRVIRGFHSGKSTFLPAIGPLMIHSL